MSKKKLTGLIALVAAALLFMLWLAGLLTWGKIAPGTVALKAPPPAARVFTVQEVEIPQELTALGTVISKTLTQVSSQVPGRVNHVWVEAGSRVKAGDPLVGLSAEEFQARVSQAQAGVAQAQAQLTRVNADYQRYQRLLKEGAVSPQEFEAMEARYKSAQAALGQAQAQVKEAATFKGYTVVQALRAGIVAERKVAVGDLAQPGQALLTLYDPRELQVEAEVNDSYRPEVRLGMPVAVSVPSLEWQAESALAEIFPISAPGSRTFKVRTGPVEHPQLVPGLFARLHLKVGETRGILIPRNYVRQIGQLTMVEVLEEGRPTLRQVKLGRHLDEKVEILAGLKPGDRLVIETEKH